MRRMARPQSCEPWVDPAEDAASMAGLALAPAVEAIAAELRRQHLEQRQAETEKCTEQKVRKWRAGVCQPIGGRHSKVAR